MSQRKSTPRGQMTRGANSGPAIMLMPPDIRQCFMPNPPLENLPPVTNRRKTEWTGMSGYLVQFEETPPPGRIKLPTPQDAKERRKQLHKREHEKELEPAIEKYRGEQRDDGVEYQGSNCYSTLFVGRLAYEVTERKLLREMEAFGPVKDIKIVKDREGKSRGYAFVEYEHEEDMKRAFRAADGMRIEGREIVCDVERGHTVPSWLPRRLGGGLGGTRLGGKDVNVTRPGRYDPSRPEAPGPSGGMGRGAGPPPPGPPLYGGYGDRGGGPIRGHPAAAPPPYGRGGGGGPPPRYDRGPGPVDWDRGDGGRYDRGGGGGRKRHRSRSPPDQIYGGGGGGGRRRY